MPTRVTQKTDVVIKGTIIGEVKVGYEAKTQPSLYNVECLGHLGKPNASTVLSIPLRFINLREVYGEGRASSR